MWVPLVWADLAFLILFLWSWSAMERQMAEEAQ